MSLLSENEGDLNFISSVEAGTFDSSATIIKRKIKCRVLRFNSFHYFGIFILH